MSALVTVQFEWSALDGETISAASLLAPGAIRLRSGAQLRMADASDAAQLRVINPGGRDGGGDSEDDEEECEGAEDAAGGGSGARDKGGVRCRVLRKRLAAVLDASFGPPTATLFGAASSIGDSAASLCRPLRLKPRAAVLAPVAAADHPRMARPIGASSDGRVESGSVPVPSRRDGASSSKRRKSDKEKKSKRRQSDRDGASAAPESM